MILPQEQIDLLKSTLDAVRVRSEETEAERDAAITEAGRLRCENVAIKSHDRRMDAVLQAALDDVTKLRAELAVAKAEIERNRQNHTDAARAHADAEWDKDAEKERADRAEADLARAVELMADLKQLCETLMDEDGDIANGPMVSESYVPLFRDTDAFLASQDKS